MHYFIGIDSSTTATKALLIDEQGDVVAVAATEYEFATPYPLWSEQDPDPSGGTAPCRAFAACSPNPASIRTPSPASA
jgi:glycerol kinase